MGKIIIISVLVLLILFVLITYNGLIRLNNRVKEAFSTMDVYLKKRWDLIPNIVSVVKGYAKHEEDTLKEITSLRSNINSYDKLSSEEKINTNLKVNNNLTKLFALVEAYPELKANENFLSLQKDLTVIED